MGNPNNFETMQLLVWSIFWILIGISTFATIWGFWGGKKGPYVYAKCKGCDNTIVYDKCIYCNRNAMFRASGEIKCLNCQNTVKGSLPCPVCNTPALIEHFRVGRKDSSLDRSGMVSMSPSAADDGGRGRKQPKETVVQGIQMPTKTLDDKD